MKKVSSLNYKLNFIAVGCSYFCAFIHLMFELAVLGIINSVLLLKWKGLYWASEASSWLGAVLGIRGFLLVRGCTGHQRLPLG